MRVARAADAQPVRRSGERAQGPVRPWKFLRHPRAEPHQARPPATRAARPSAGPPGHLCTGPSRATRPPVLPGRPAIGPRVHRATHVHPATDVHRATRPLGRGATCPPGPPCHRAYRATGRPGRPFTGLPRHRATGPSGDWAARPPLHPSTRSPLQPSTPPPVHPSTRPPGHPVGRATRRLGASEMWPEALSMGIWCTDSTCTGCSAAGDRGWGGLLPGLGSNPPQRHVPGCPWAGRQVVHLRDGVRGIPITLRCTTRPVDTSCPECTSRGCSVARKAATNTSARLTTETCQLRGVPELVGLLDGGAVRSAAVSPPHGVETGAPWAGRGRRWSGRRWSGRRR
ncbi:hypothetical protein JOF29_002188 [Kribbella aluminosa]|uniref:Uncharacterized protein n=1 Tax=Kribbella aluminosa TaxID=416017 RepID=A0ABS4UHK5_9ACTN|nr:hypothetical protein [Kribbella aluminosa]